MDSIVNQQKNYCKTRLLIWPQQFLNCQISKNDLMILNMNKSHPPRHTLALNKPKGKALLRNTHLYIRIHKNEELSQAPKENSQGDIIEHFLSLHVNFSFHSLIIPRQSSVLLGIDTTAGGLILETPVLSCQGVSL